jgi:hypothetical protein
MALPLELRLNMFVPYDPHGRPVWLSFRCVRSEVEATNP